MPYFPFSISIKAAAVALSWAQGEDAPEILGLGFRRQDLEEASSRTDDKVSPLLPPIEIEKEVLYGLPNFSALPLYCSMKQTRSDILSQGSIDDCCSNTWSRTITSSPESQLSSYARPSSYGYSPALTESSGASTEGTFDEENFPCHKSQAFSSSWIKELTSERPILSDDEDIYVTKIEILDQKSSQSIEDPDYIKLFKYRQNRKSLRSCEKYLPKLQSIEEEDYFYSCLPTNFRIVTYTVCQSGVLPSVFEDDSENEEKGDEQRSFRSLRWRSKKLKSKQKIQNRQRARSQPPNALVSIMRKNSRKSLHD
ncbi:expressed protein [Phakopsora pachyrhizi]|uniref:Expressed protein n=1 Tax=Phakopsora pachyrhizi TaxID=170000 RepID=A0AAV0ADY1_PHAPC|nr:expressed protein [Phakopsora pachyrhizi]